MDQLTFGNSAALLRANGYAPAPCGDSGKPLGPFAVMQIGYERYATNDTLPVAALTAIPPPRNELEPVQNHRGTWLARLTISVRDKLKPKVDAIVKRYVGAARCPVLIGDDGSALYVFRTSEAFPGVHVDHAHEPEYARADVSASFIPVGGNWRDGVDLLSVMRAELPELDHLKAEEIISELNALLHDHAAPIELPKPPARKPLVEPGKHLLFGNSRAMQELCDKGYTPCLVSWDEKMVPKLEPHVAQYSNGYRLDDERFADFGVGLLTNYARSSTLMDSSPQKSGATHLAELEVRARPDIAAAIHSIIVARHGSGPVRIGSDGSRLYLFKRAWGMPLASTDFLRGATGANGFAVLGTTVRINIASAAAIVVSGTDDGGKPYRWEHGDPLTVARDDLPALDGNLAGWILRAVENLLASGDFSEEPPAPKRARKTA